MPVKVSHTLPAREVRKGDTFLSRDEYGAIATAVADRPTVKTVWAYIPLDGVDKPLRVKADEEVTVERMEPTAEELEADKQAYLLRSVQRGIDEAPVKLAAALDKLLQDPSSHWAIEAYVSAKETADLWAAVARLAERDDHDLVTARAAVVEEETSRFMQRFDRRSSRSTSVMANAVEDVQLDARAAFVREGRWGW